MRETLRLFKNVIRHPGQVVNELNTKSLKLYIILLLINGIAAGGLFFFSKFVWDPVGTFFWLAAVGSSATLWVYLGLYQSIYYLISRFVFKEQQNRGIKLITYYFLIAFTFYHLVAVGVIIILVSLNQFGIATTFYDISHMMLIFWIGALCAQGIQQLRKEEDLRTMLKVFPALFSSYAVNMLLFFILARGIIGLAYG